MFLWLTSAHPEISGGTSDVSNSEMRYFCAELGRTRIFAEAYTEVRRRRKTAENDAQRKKDHFWMETNYDDEQLKYELNSVEEMRKAF
jgi:hypothetical protein